MIVIERPLFYGELRSLAPPVGDPSVSVMELLIFQLLLAFSCLPFLLHAVSYIVPPLCLAVSDLLFGSSPLFVFLGGIASLEFSFDYPPATEN